MWSDNETKQDLLGFKVHADLVKEVVLDKELSPVIIGVFGDWGSGKSSVLKIIQSDLEANEDIACLYFNGWLFEGYDDAKAALLESILDRLANDKKFGAKVKDEADKLIQSVNWMRAVRLGFKNVGLPVLAAYLTGGTSLINTISERLLAFIGDAKENPDAIVKKLQSQEASEIVSELVKSNQGNSEVGVKQFRQKFKELLEKTGVKSLVILIDDLDRCSPERILENLEAIKLFLNVENTAFIIGADQRLVEQAVRFKYRDDEKLVKEYLEKVIQIPYHLPKLSTSEVATYMSLLFCKRILPKDSFEKVVNSFHSFRETDRYSVYSFSKIKECLELNTLDFPSDLKNKLLMVHSIAPLITKGLQGNPRQIKRYLNAFVLRKKLATVAKLSDFQDDILAKLMILEYTEETLFRELYNWQAIQEGFPQEVQQLEKFHKEEDEENKLGNQISDGWKKEKIIKWIKLEPSLSTIDLRDYFWITRDRLSESISSSIPIPPIVKSTIQELYDTNPTEKNLEHTINIKVKTFGEADLDGLYKLLKSRVIKDSNDKVHFDIYYALIRANIDRSIDMYLEILGMVGHSIPPAVAYSLIELAKEHSQFSSIIDELKKSDSKIGKAILLKQKIVK